MDWQNMKYLGYFLFIVSLFILWIYLFIEPAVIFLAKGQIEKILPAAVVSIGRLDIKPFHHLTFSDIEINKYPVYDFKIKEAGIAYNIFSLLGAKIIKFHLKEADISVNMAQNNLSEFNKYLNLKARGGFSLGALELSNANLQVESRDLNLRAQLSLELEPLNQIVRYCALNIDSLDFNGFHLQDASLRVKQMPEAGEFSVGLMRYDKLRVKGIKSKAVLEGSRLRLDSLRADFLEGQIQGDLDFRIDKKPQYLLNLKFLDCAVSAFVRDFNLQKKFTASGLLSGALTLKGSGPDLSILSADFLAVKPGGVLSIVDTKFLEGMARNSGESLDLLVESFKNYRYNEGVIKLSLDKNNLILEAALEGEAGRRNLTVTIHNFELWREAK
jgi:hypothetical protein